MSSQVSSSQQGELVFTNHSTQRLCAIHENQQCTLLCTDPTRTDCAFKCDYCVVDQALQGKYLIPISQIQNSNNKTVFWHWPLTEDSDLIRKIRELSVRPKTDVKYKEQIDKYFKELRIEVLAKIDCVQQQMCKQAEQLWDFDDRILGQYNVFCAKETLKKIVQDSQTEMDQLSLKMRETTAGVVSCKEATKVALEASLSQLALQESAVDFEGPARIKEEVLKKLSSISMFLVENMRDLVAELPDREQEVSENVNAIVSLATSKLNNTTERFQEQLRRQLQKFGKVLSKVDLGDVKAERKRVDEITLLDQEEIEEVQSFVSALIECKKKKMQEKLEDDNAVDGDGDANRNRKRRLQVQDITQLVKCKANHMSEEAAEQIQRMLGRIGRYVESFEVQSIYQEGFQQERFENLNDSEIQRSQIVVQELKELLREGENNERCLRELVGIGQQMVKGQLQQHQQQRLSGNGNYCLTVDKVLEMVSNETNFCSEEFLGKLRTALEGVKNYMKSFEVDRDVEEQRGLEKEQLSWLGRLGSKVRELSQRYGEEFAKRVRPMKKWQQNSARICGILKKELDLGQNEVEEIELLLSQLPVFEMLKINITELIERNIRELREGKSIKLPWALTTFQQSSSLQLMDAENGARIVQKTSANTGQAVTNVVLDNNLVYSLTCTFNKSIPGDKTIYVGLFQDDKINTSNRGGQGYNSGFSSHSINNDKEIIKGQLLNSAPVNSLLTVLHLRFCISTQSFFFADQTHTNINKLKLNYFNKDGKYRLGVYFGNPGDDYWCCISDVRVYSDQSVVDQF